MKTLFLTLSLVLLACAHESPVLDGQDYTEAFTYQKQTVCTAVRDLGLANMDQCLYMDHVRILLVSESDMFTVCESSVSCYRPDLQIIYVYPGVNPADVRHEYIHAAMDQLGLDDTADTVDGHSGMFLSILNHNDPMVNDHE